jgi:hypothetical protein
LNIDENEEYYKRILGNPIIEEDDEIIGEANL